MARILMVDDEKSIRITLREFLRGEGYDVQVAADAFEATDILERDAIDVLVCDIILPKLSGVELLKSIRKVSPFVKVITMTGEPTLETATEALRKDAFDYLTKPIGKQAILSVVAKAVQVRSLEDEKRRLEEENHNYRSQLERLVQERTRQLQQSKDKYRGIVENVDLGIVLISPKLEVLELNRRMREWFPGTDTEDPRYCYECCVDPPRNSPCLDCPTVRTLADGGVHEVIRKVADDRRTVWRMVASPVIGAEGKVASVIKIVEDITDRFSWKNSSFRRRKWRLLDDSRVG